MAEPGQPDASAGGWTPEAVKEHADSEIRQLREEIQRAVDVAREGKPPHISVEKYFEMLLNEREKAVQLALTSADKLEQERLARNTDRIECERRVGELRAALSKTAIDKAEEAAAKQFDDFSKAVNTQLGDMRQAIQDLTRRIDTGLGG